MPVCQVKPDKLKGDIMNHRIKVLLFVVEGFFGLVVLMAVCLLIGKLLIKWIEALGG